MAPERLRGDKKDEHLLVKSSGAYLSRGDVRKSLEAAAIAEGVDPNHLGSHSLRIGGASALWASFKDTALIQRWGRWKSDAFQGYIWEDSEVAKGVADQMAAANIELI